MMPHRECRLLLTFAFLSIFVSAQVAIGSESDSLPICKVLADPTKTNGKLIAIRGPIVETGEGVWLDGSHCEHKLVTGGYKWPMLVWLDLSSSSHSQEQFEKLSKNVNAINEELRLKKFDATKDLVWLTITGVLRTYENLSTHQRQGFGHMNAAPAELVVLSEADPVIDRGRRSGREKSK